MFPELFNKWNIQYEKGEYEGEGREGVGAIFMSQNRHFMEHGIGNTMPELTLTPLKSWL